MQEPGVGGAAALKTATLERLAHTDEGTLGALVAGSFSCRTMEPPWRDNQPNRSCIIEGTYRCVWHRSPRYGEVYLVAGVPGRSHILIHPGNVGGDTALGLHTHTRGCILLGRRHGALDIKARRQRAVLLSRPTVAAFARAMGNRPFLLEVS